jgi:enamine deaminase RidA (YjgF/YER057c/UK114 family)
MPLQRFNPKNIAPPNSPSYHHAIHVAPTMRWLVLAGQVGKSPDGTLPSSFEQQCENCWDNIFAILAEGGMGREDIVKLTVYLTRREDREANAAIRAKKMGSIAPASTFLLVAGLAQPEFLIEIDVVAAKD